MVFDKLKSKIASLCLAGLLLFSENAKANFKEDQAVVLVTNMATSCLISGIGSKYHKEGFFKGCGKGLIAGGIIYGGKEIARHTEYDGLPLLGKLVHSTGVSMRDNVAEGNEMFENYKVDFGPVLFSFDRKEGFDAYLLPGSLGGLAYNIASGNKFDIENTLKFGTPIFRFEEDKIAEILSGVEDVIGATKTNIMAIGEDNNISEDEITKHEFTHALQYREGTWLDQVIESDRLIGKQKYIKLGPDAQLILIGILPQLTVDYKDRPLEFEAFEGYTK